MEREAAELRDPDLEGDACSRRGLLEDHPQRPAGEELVGLAPALQLLELVRQIEHRLQVSPAPGADPQEVAALQVLGERSHRARLC
jgi:hypothetical protein